MGDNAITTAIMDDGSSGEADHCLGAPARRVAAVLADVTDSSSVAAVLGDATDSTTIEWVPHTRAPGGGWPPRRPC